MTKEVQRADVQTWINLWHSSASIDRLEGAPELAEIAVRTRVRGTIRTHRAISRFGFFAACAGMSLSAALDAFKDPHVEVRRVVAFALGERAGSSA